MSVQEKRATIGLRVGHALAHVHTVIGTKKSGNQRSSKNWRK